MRKLIVRRGDVYYAEMELVQGSEQGGVRPVLILQNSVGNYYSPTTVVAVMTTKTEKAKIPTHVELEVKGKKGKVLPERSIVLLEQIRTLDKSRFTTRSRKSCKRMYVTC